MFGVLISHFSLSLWPPGGYGNLDSINVSGKKHFWKVSRIMYVPDLGGRGTHKVFLFSDLNAEGESSSVKYTTLN